MKPFAALAVVFAMSGCATSASAPPALTLQEADYGARPDDYEDAVRQYFAATLKDPGAVEYQELTHPEKGFMRDHSVIAGTKFTYGWIVRATVNAKNAYGGYVGFRTYTFLFRGDRIVDALLPDSE